MSCQNGNIVQYDTERLRRDLLAYYESVALGGCGHSLVFNAGITHGDEADLLEYASLAGFNLKRYQM